MLIDRFGRQVDYVRLSVTDRCDFRCIYCMAEDMTFVPRREVLSLEELHRVARVFTDLGVSRIRLTGGDGKSVQRGGVAHAIAGNDMISVIPLNISRILGDIIVIRVGVIAVNIAV